MSMMVAPYRFASLAASQTGALIMKGANSTGVVVGAAISYTSENYDRSSFHDNVTNPNRITIASPGLYRFFESYNGNAVVNFQSLGGTGPLTVTAGRPVTYSDAGFGSLQSGILSLAAADYGEIANAGNTSNYTATDYCWFGVELIDPAIRYALVTKSASQALLANTDATLTFNTEAADTTSFHDNVTNNSRLTVPSGVTCVRLSAGILSSASFTGQMFGRISQNGAAAYGLPRKDRGGAGVAGQKAFTLFGAPIEVVAGDYFELIAQTEAAVSVGGDNRTWFQIEEIPASTGRCLVRASSAATLTATVSQNLAFDTEVYDTAAIHDDVTDNSRLTVPSGYTQARLTFCVSALTATGSLSAQVTKNGSAAFPGNVFDTVDTAGADNVSSSTHWLDVAPGDYFQLSANAATTRNVDHLTSWFGIEVR